MADEIAESSLQKSVSEAPQLEIKPIDLRDSAWRQIYTNNWGCGRPGGLVVYGIGPGMAEGDLTIYLDPKERTDQPTVRKMIKVSAGRISVGETTPGTYNQQSHKPDTLVTNQNFILLQPDLALANTLVQSVTNSEITTVPNPDYTPMIEKIHDKWSTVFYKVGL